MASHKIYIAEKELWGFMVMEMEISDERTQ
jgi:hypothetical protein